MDESQPQRSVAAHGNSGDPTRGAPGADPVPALNRRHELLQEEILVAHPIIVRIDKKTRIAGRRDHQEFPDFVVGTQILQQIQAAGPQKHLFVVAQTVKKIEDRIAACWLARITGR